MFTSAAAANVAENSTAVLTISATDGDSPAQTVSFSISGNGADDTKFQITGGNQLVFIAAPDFETPLDANADNVYEVELVADDGNGLTTLQTVLVTVDPVNDNAPVFTSATAVSVAENSTAVQTISATDGDLPAQTVSFSVSGTGADDANSRSPAAISSSSSPLPILRIRLTKTETMFMRSRLKRTTQMDSSRVT